MTWRSTLGSFLYHATFTLCFILTTVLVAGSCVSIVLQARLASRGVANWNVLIVVGSYLALGIISAIIFLSRRHTGLKRLKTIPKPYVAVKRGDVPKPVSDLIAEEYTRACIAAAVSRPTGRTHPGWGAPESEYANVHFRSAILQTILDLDSLARKFLPELPALRPHRPMIEHLRPLSFVLLQEDPCRLKDYDELVEQARYDEEEPTEDDWRRCEEIVEQMKTILTFYIKAGATDDGRRPSRDQYLHPPHGDPYASDGFYSATSSPIAPYLQVT
ncbi:hypothetical protein FS837_006016 [Tulasnella sp. UAMH 9824]|nr:hypothetical protein FS837_006016 [Tulasnella sp. UAMH 9824]